MLEASVLMRRIVWCEWDSNNDGDDFVVEEDGTEGSGAGVKELAKVKAIPGQDIPNPAPDDHTY